MRTTLYSFFLTVAISISSIASAQYLPLKDFQDQSITSGGWSSYVVTSTPGSYDWETSDQGSTGDFYAKASGWNGSSADETELWLISASFDLSSATSPVLTFSSAVNFNGPAIEIFISSDYDGSSDPTVQGTWTDITSLATLSPGSFTWTNSGDIDLSSYNGTDMYIAFKYTSDPANGAATWEFDNITVAEPATIPEVSIFDVQNTTDPSGDSDYDSQVVKTYGIVCAIRPGGGNNNPQGFYIQDGNGPWTGLFVQDDNITVSEGDSVDVTGTLNEVFSQTQMENVTDHTIHGSGYSIDTTQVTTSEVNDEEFEGVLVQVTTATCTNPSVGFGQFEVDDNSGTCLVDDEIYQYPNPQQNTKYDITGPIRYSFSESKIEPRRASDVEVSPFNSIVEEFNSITIFPNPAVDHIMIKIEGEFSYNLIDMTGKSVATGSGNNKKMVDVNTYNSGVYFLSLNSKGSTQTVKVIKK